MSLLENSVLSFLLLFSKLTFHLFSLYVLRSSFSSILFSCSLFSLFPKYHTSMFSLPFSSFLLSLSLSFSFLLSSFIFFFVFSFLYSLQCFLLLFNSSLRVFSTILYILFSFFAFPIALLFSSLSYSHIFFSLFPLSFLSTTHLSFHEVLYSLISFLPFSLFSSFLSALIAVLFSQPPPPQ